MPSRTFTESRTLLAFFFFLAGTSWGGPANGQTGAGAIGAEKEAAMETHFAGYMGRKHQLAFDLVQLHDGRYKLDYFYALKKHFGLYAIAAYQKKSFESLSELSEFRVGTPENLKLDRVSASGYSWGLGYKSNSPFAELPLPVGYYTSIAFQRSNANVLYEYNNIQDPVLIENLSTLIKFEYGRNFNLTDHLNLSLSLDLGYTWGSYTLQEDAGVPEPGELPMPPRPFPSNALIFRDELRGDFSLFGADFIGFYFYPAFELGLML